MTRWGSKKSRQNASSLCTEQFMHYYVALQAGYSESDPDTALKELKKSGEKVSTAEPAAKRAKKSGKETADKTSAVAKDESTKSEIPFFACGCFFACSQLTSMSVLDTVNPQSDSDEPIRFCVEYAKSNKSKCKGCGEAIDKAVIFSSF